MSTIAQTCSVLCPITAIRSLVVESLARQGIHDDPAATITVVLDLPRGLALASLPTLVSSRRRVIVISWSRCPEYLEDLWDLRPHILIAGNGMQLDLATPIMQAAQGVRYRLTPGIATTLTPIERRMLQLIARGYANQQIAAEFGLQLQTVKNIVAAIYQKLGLKNRSAALLYYWDIWRSAGDETSTPTERYLGS